MARRKKDASIDLSQAHELSAGLIEALRCPEGKKQAFLRDAKAPGLQVRVTAAGAKSYVFETRIRGRTMRRTIGKVSACGIEDARAEANELRRLKDKKLDPRELEREEAERKAREKAEADARAAAQAAEEAARSIIVGSVWPRYLAEGKPLRKDAWKPRYRADLMKAAAPGGEKRKRGEGVTLPGHLAPLMALRLVDIDADTMRDWYVKEAKRSPRQAKRAAAMFSGFLRWCSLQRDYRDLVKAKAASAESLSDLMPGKKTRTDALELEQLKPWFAGTDKLRSRTARAYLQALVLTGARREEMAALKWADIDFVWKKLTLADKVEDRRVIPLTPYLASVLAALPRLTLGNGEANPFVFAAPIGKKSGKPRSASGRITEPRAYHADVLTDAGIPHVSIHGLRRTFALMGEQAGAPAGAIAQVMGHKPSAIAEGYKPRSIDVLRPYMEQIERFILDKAGIAFDAEKAVKGGLRLVSAA